MFELLDNIDDNDSICRDRKAEILQWFKSMSDEEIAEQFELRDADYFTVK